MHSATSTASPLGSTAFTGPAAEEEPDLSLWTSWILAAAQNARSPSPTNSQEALEIFGQFHNTI